MNKDESPWISPKQLFLAVIEFPQIKEKYVKKLEYLMQKDGQRDQKKRKRIETLLSHFAHEVIQLDRKFKIDDEKKSEETCEEKSST